MEEIHVRATLKERFQYRFDNFMAAGARSIFLALILLFIGAFVVTGSLRLVILRTTPVQMDAKGAPQAPSLRDDLWTAFIQILDPGSVTEDNNSAWFVKVVAVITVLMGLVFFSAVIAFITTQLDLKITSLKKGRSRVLEADHTLILGWGDRVLEIVAELIIANESEKDAAVVILSEIPKEEMDDFFQERLIERKTTRIITRTGVTSSLEALERVAVTDCRSVIVLPSANESSTWEEKVASDSKTLKSVLAVVAASREDQTKAAIVTEVFDRTNRNLMQSLAPDNITVIDTEDILAKIIVQTSRSTGLAAVYGHLIGFAGCEFYFAGGPWNGVTFGQAGFHLPDGVPLGVRDSSGALHLRPSPELVLGDGDELILIAEDDSTIRFNKTYVCSPRSYPGSSEKLAKRIERQMIIGWNSKAATIIDQYTDYVLPGSNIDIVLPTIYSEGTAGLDEIQQAHPQHAIRVLSANARNARELATLRPETYDNVIILNKSENDMEKVDSQTIMILLQLRALFQETALKSGTPVRTQIISEVMDSDNLELIAKTGANDFIISNQMISKIFAQVSQNPDVLRVYEQLFEEEGSEIYLKPVRLYFDTLPSEPLTFGDLMLAAQARDEICLGFRLKDRGASVEDHFGVVLNPPKDRAVRVSPGDHLIVLAEDES